MREGYRKLLFWTDLPEIEGKLKQLTAGNQLLGALGRGLVESLQRSGVLGRDPKQWISNRMPQSVREYLAKALVGGEVIMRYMGHANCRICGAELGNADMAGYGFVWPEKAEHYVLEHNVWTPECNDLYMALVEDTLDEHQGKQS